LPDAVILGLGAGLLCASRARLRDAGYRVGLRRGGGLGRPGSPLSARRQRLLLMLEQRIVQHAFERFDIRMGKRSTNYKMYYYASTNVMR
jgi:hypothetical protein